MLVINLSCLWSAFALRWTTEQDETELEHALAAASTEAFLVREAIEINVSAVANVASEVFNAAYFRKRGRELLRTLKSDDGSRARVDEPLAFLRGLWGMLSPVSNSKEEEDALILARLCQVLHFKGWPLREPRNQHSTHEIVSFQLGIGLNHSCYPNFRHCNWRGSDHRLRPGHLQAAIGLAPRAPDAAWFPL